MGETCSTHGEDESIQQFLSVNLKERGHLGEPRLDVRIIQRNSV